MEYFFDQEYVNLIELKLEIYFQQTAPFSTVEGITTIIVKELLKRKKELRLKYARVHEICSVGQNFFTNVYSVIKLVSNYRRLARSASHLFATTESNARSKDMPEGLEALQSIRTRTVNRKPTEKLEKTEKWIEQAYEISKTS